MRESADDLQVRIDCLSPEVQEVGIFEFSTRDFSRKVVSKVRSAILIPG
jgi:hypothetical protein